MAEKQRNELKAGIYILVTIGLILGVIFAITGAKGWFAAENTYRVVFVLADDVGGLRVGDEVRVGGFRVGEVKEINLVTESTAAASQPGLPLPRVEVVVSMPAKYELRKTDLNVRIGGTLTGTSWVIFNSLGTGEAVRDGGTFKGEPSYFSSLTSNLGGTLTDLREQTVPRINGAIDDFRQTTLPRVNQTIDAFKTTAQTTTDTVGHIRSKVDPAIEKYDAVASSARGAMERGSEALVNVRDLTGDIKTDFRGTVANLNSITGKANQKLPGLLDQVDRILQSADKAVGDIRGSTADLKAALANAKDLTGAARGLIVSNRTKLEGMIASLKKTADNLEATSVSVRHSPWRLLYKPQPNEMANLNLYDAARQFAEGAGALSTAAGSLRDALEDPETDEAKIQKLLEEVNRSFNGFQTVENKLWTEVKQ